MTSNVIQLDKNHRTVAVRLSGGPDSAIIYHAVCDFYKDDPTAEIYPYTMASPLRPHAIRKACDVIDIVTQLTGRSPTYHYTVMHDAHNSSNDFSINSVEYTKGQEDLEALVFKTHTIDARYTGLSINCPVDDMLHMIENSNVDKVACRVAVATRDTSRDVPTEMPVCQVGPTTMYLPFANCDKRVVYKLYNDYNVLDELYPYTWSCENDMQSQHQNPVHCGTCYFCLERLYTFGKL